VGEESVTNDDRPGRPPFIPGTPEKYDAVIAAPENHEVVFENDKVRVVNVLVKPGERENMHTHSWPSVFLINSFPELNYYLEDGTSTPRTGRRREGVPAWIDPEGIHAVENIDTRPFEGVRIELKD
jgi:quercetin dioxygenase-like cupin family protein